MNRADIAVALDLPNGREALALVDAIGDACSWYKVGPVLFVSEGRELVRALRERGKRVFLDLKWHDIPSTVAGAVRAAASLDVELATVHLAGGARMLEAAAAAAGPGLRLVGVGVLTSFTADEFGQSIGRVVSDLSAEQRRLVRAGVASGIRAFVTSPPEAPALREVAGPDVFLVVPGIRGASDAADDQRRVATAREAAANGADLLVVGRPVTGSPAPKARVIDFREEIRV